MTNGAIQPLNGRVHEAGLLPEKEDAFGSRHCGECRPDFYSGGKELLTLFKFGGKAMPADGDIGRCRGVHSEGGAVIAPDLACGGFEPQRRR